VTVLVVVDDDDPVTGDPPSDCPSWHIGQRMGPFFCFVATTTRLVETLDSPLVQWPVCPDDEVIVIVMMMIVVVSGDSSSSMMIVMMRCLMRSLPLLLPLTLEEKSTSYWRNNHIPHCFPLFLDLHLRRLLLLVLPMNGIAQKVDGDDDSGSRSLLLLGLWS
jgi:hypothetical protein